MKRLLALILTVAILLSTCTHIFPLAANAEESAVHITRFGVSDYSVLVGEKEKVTFTASLTDGAAYHKQKVYVYDDDGNRVSRMYDDGTHGDKTAHDGTYTAQVLLASDRKQTKLYHAETLSSVSMSQPVKFRSELGKSDVEEAEALWDDLEEYKRELASAGLTPQQIAASAFGYVERVHGDVLDSITWESDKSFSFTLKSGIENYFEHIEMKEPSETKNASTVLSTTSYIGKNAIGVWSPFYGFDDSFTQSYLERAQKMAQTAGYEAVDAYYGADADLESFKNFDKYGIVMIDSHGADYDGGGYIMIPSPGNYDAQDLADGHIVLSGNIMLMRGTYIAKYCDTLPQTIVYTGICHGMAADNFYAPLINHGASFVAGYTDAVTFTFDGIIMNDFCQHLAEKNPSTGAQYTTGEAYESCVSLHGDTDPYTSHNAKFVYYGNPNTVATAKSVAVESIELTDGDITLYHNNTYALNLSVTPQDANKYKSEWISDSPNIVTVDENGVLHAGDTDGVCTVTCTVTDNYDENSPVTYTDSIRVTVSGSMPVSGIEIERFAITLYENSSASQKIAAHVLPLNASNHTLLYESSDTGIAVVDADGNVMPKGAGTAFITVKTQDSGFWGTVTVYVVSGGVNAALNKINGIINFNDDSRYPSECIADEGRYCIKTTNAGKSNSSASISLDSLFLTAGTVIKFDWRVSSEAQYDIFKFMVNNSVKHSISGNHRWESVTYTVEEDGEYFVRWAYTKDYSTDAEDDCAMLDEIDIIRPNEMHTVNFVDFDGVTLLGTQNVPHGEAALAPDLPVHEGATFKSWSADFSQVRSSMTVRALFDISHDACVVTFLGKDGKLIAQRTALSGNAVTPPQAPHEEGFIFYGWDKDITCVTEDLTVQALYGIAGDINADGKLNTGDAAYILRCSAGIITPSDMQLALGDFNSDGKVNTGDAALILRWAAAQA